MSTTSCDPFSLGASSSTTSDCEIIGIEPAPAVVDSSAIECEPQLPYEAEVRPSAPAQEIIIISNPSDSLIKDLLCKKFKIGCPSTTSRRPISTTTSTTSRSTTTQSTTSVGLCDHLSDIVLSWQYIPSNCPEVDYGVRLQAIPFSSADPGGIFSGSVDGDRTATWSISMDGGSSWEIIVADQKSIAGNSRIDSWLKNRPVFMLKVLTDDGEDVYTIAFTANQQDAITLIGSKRYVSGTGCYDGYWRLVVPDGITVSDLTLLATGDLRIERISDREFRATGFVGTVTGTVTLSCNGKQAILIIPPLHTKDGKLTTFKPVWEDAEGFVYNAPDQCQRIVAFVIPGGYLFKTPVITVTGGSVAATYNALTYLINQSDAVVCVKLTYIDTSETVKSITKCLDACTVTTTSTTSSPNCAKNGGLLTFNLGANAICKVITGLFSLQWPPVSITTSSSSSSSSTSVAPDLCTFAIDSIWQADDNYLSVDLRDLGTQDNFAWEILSTSDVRLYGPILTPVSPTGLFYAKFSDSGLPYGNYKLRVTAPRTPGSPIICVSVVPFSFFPVTTTSSSSSTTSMIPVCTFGLGAIQQDSDNIFEIAINSPGTQTNWKWQLFTLFSVPLSVPTPLSVVGGVGFFNITELNLSSGNYYLVVSADKASGSSDTCAVSKPFSYTRPVTTSSTTSTGVTTSSSTTSVPPVCTFGIDHITQTADGQFDIYITTPGTQIEWKYQLRTLTGQNITGILGPIALGSGNILHIDLTTSVIYIPPGSYLLNISARVAAGSLNGCESQVNLTYAPPVSTSTSTSSSTTSSGMTTTSSSSSTTSEPPPSGVGCDVYYNDELNRGTGQAGAINRLNLTTGVSTLVRTIAKVYTDIAVVGDDFYLINYSSNPGSVPSSIDKINAISGTLTHVNYTGYTDVCTGLCFDNAGNLYAAGGSITKMNPDGTFVKLFDLNGQCQGDILYNSNRNSFFVTIDTYADQGTSPKPNGHLIEYNATTGAPVSSLVLPAPSAFGMFANNGKLHTMHLNKTVWQLSAPGGTFTQLTSITLSPFMDGATQKASCQSF